ncbi:MAG: 4-hydroxythreonine-4-phosphate dehydrogenase PdxA [Salibacteraceae bacterium]
MGKHKKLRVGISVGDINGIGLEVIIKALSDARTYEHCTPVIYGSKDVVKTHSQTLNLEGFHFHSCSDVEKSDSNKVNLVEVWSEKPDVHFGSVTSEGGDYAFRSLKAAVEDLASTKIDVLVTAPINKKNIQSKDFDFPGHTEYLASYANEENPLMILCQNKLRVALATGHIPLEKVASSLEAKEISIKLEVFNKSLIQDFGIHRPKIAVLGLNPHNGDDGLLGDEEKRIITPAIEMAKESGILAFGPFPADGFFGSPLRGQFDGVMAMYHDQGLTPFKALAFDDGVNFTAGLPIVRTSPDHGVAYDIAGKNLASARSMRAAIHLACDIYHERQNYRDIASNPLEISDSN